MQGPTAIEGDKEGQCDAPRISFEEDVCRHFAKQELEQELAELTNLSMGELLDSQDTKELLDSQDTKCVQLGPGATVVLRYATTATAFVLTQGLRSVPTQAWTNFYSCGSAHVIQGAAS